MRIGIDLGGTRIEAIAIAARHRWCPARHRRAEAHWKSRCGKRAV